MPRSPSTYSLPPGTTPQQPNTVISSSMFNAFADDVAQTFNTVQPIVYGGTGSNDLKLTDTDFGIKDNGDPTKIGQFNASGLPTATTRIYDLPYYSGTLGLVSDIRGQIYGLTMSNNATDPINDIDIATGNAVDSSGTASMLLASALGKRLDAAWAVGGTPAAAVGGLDTGAIANGTYHVYLIRRPDTGVVDACFSASASAPTTGGSIPAAYTQYRRIGSVQRVSGALVGFIQTGDDFTYINGPNTDRSSTAAQANTLLTVFVPTGIIVYPKISIQMTSTAGIDAGTILADGNQSTANVLSCYVFSAGQASAISIVNSFRTNTAGQIRYSVTITGGTLAGTNQVRTWGYTDRRGRDA